MRNTSYRYWMIYVIAIVAAMGGLLFGFDTGVISMAIPFFQKDFGIDDSMVEVVTSSGLLGAILGALCCGKLTDRIGRRKVILTSAVIFTFGALGSGWAPGIYHLIVARLFLGVAIGISSFAVPLYIAEVSPVKSRGMFVAMFQLMITIGLLVSYISMQHIYIADYQRLFILIGTTSVFTSTQNVGTNAMCCISQLCIYVLYRLLSAILRNVRYQIQRVD